MHIYVKKNNIFFAHYKAKCAIGKKGISSNKKEGDLKTPRGKFLLESVFYRSDRIKKIQTKLKLKIIKPNMGWCDDPSSKKYNHLIKLPFKYSYENLYRKSRLYDIIIVISYNRKNIKKRKGSAIFLHLATKNFKPTHGCIAVSKTVMLNVLKHAEKKTKITIQ